MYLEWKDLWNGNIYIFGIGKVAWILPSFFFTVGFLELIWSCLFGVLISISGMAGWIWCGLTSLRCCFRVGEISSVAPANF